ncbi:MAG: TetR family transcriptional regulator [Gemmatimonadota bacterium]|nr:MAG: TetR family transcriptional regulator [Gemmatimonadota bacterium]
MPESRAASTSSAHVLEKRRRRRAEILHAALTAFRENGYHTTTLDDIAERLGVRKTALYHYFPDKESILYECHRESLAEIERMIEEAQGRYDTPGGRLAYLIREHVRIMTEGLEGSPLAFEVPALSPERRAEIVAARDRYEGVLRDLIVQGIEAGEFREVDPKIAVFAMLGAINWIARWYRPDGPVHPPELGAQFADHLIGGLKCQPVP